MSETEKPGAERYEMKAIQILVHLNKQGDFGWVPTAQACDTLKKAETIIDVLTKMPRSRRLVWTERLDVEDTISRCPVIRDNADLNRKFTDLTAAAHNRLEPRINKTHPFFEGQQP